MVNFMYPAADGRLKTLNFVINNEAYLDAILTCGERVDGSSLFPFIEAGSSDLYVVPRFRTAFIDPFLNCPHCQCSVLISIRMVNRWKVLRNIPCVRHVRHSLRLRGWNFRLWENWNIMSFLKWRIVSGYRPAWLSRIGPLCQVQWFPYGMYVIYCAGRRTDKVWAFWSR